MLADIRKLPDYRELIVNFAVREIKAKYKQALLGVTWAIIQPVVLMGMMTVVFSYFARIPSEGIPKARSGSLLILAAVLATGACDRAQHYTDEEYVQKAKAFQDQGKLDAALIELKNALQKNSKNSEARWRLAEVYIGQDLGEPAENELKKAKELGMNTEALKILMGQALLLQGLYPRVLAEIQPGPNSTPANVAKILEIQGRAHHGLLHFDEGCRLFFALSVTTKPRKHPTEHYESA